MADIYRAFAALIRSDAEAAELFAQLAMEEDQHGTQVALLFRLLPSMETYPRVDETFARGVKVFEDAAAKAMRVVSDRGIVTGLQLARIAHLLESTALESHTLGQLICCDDANLEKTIRMLRLGDEKHALRLTAFIKGREAADAAR